MQEACGTADVARYAEEYGQKQLEKGNITNALMACEFLPLSRDAFNLFNKVGEKAISLGQAKQIESLLHSKIMPSVAWRSSLGEPSPELLSRKTLFQQMRKDANPKELNAIIDDCIDVIDEVIKMELRADQEIQNPRP
jgi:hypothetical protein